MNAVAFALLYAFFMVPTYVLPYFGSNSLVMNALTGMANVAFFIHLFALLILMGIAFLRGWRIQRRWLVVFPFLAMLFDLVPGLSIVPMVPTAMHALAILFGVIL